MMIGINCGHTVDGQPGSGAVGYISESAQTRNVGKRVIELLKKRGISAVDCTNDYAHTTTENLAQICRMANDKPLDLFVSIHFNSGGGKGTEVYTSGGERYDEAENVCKSLSALGFVNRGVKDGSGLYVIRHTRAKAMLIEVCFVDSAEDTALYKNLGADRIAEAICSAIAPFKTEDLKMQQYEELKKEIQALKPMVYDYIDENMPAWARPTIKKLTSRSLIAGDEKGRLGLTDEMLKIFTVLDRAGIFG